MTPIRLEEISKCYGAGASAVWALHDISLAIAPGELFFLLGPSGCGKTTLLRIIAGLLETSCGQVCFGDRNVTNVAIEDRNTALVFQNYALWPHMTVQRNVEFGPKMRGASAAERAQRAGDALRCVEMQDYASRKPNQLSGGQQQRVAVARALAAAPDYLLLDEPLSNLDARLRLHMRGELHHLIKGAGTTAVYVTHDQKEALSMADRIAVMNTGRIAQVGTPEELYHRPATRFVADFLGEANFVDGTAQPDGQSLRIDTPLGAIAARGDQRPDPRVTCCIRPESIEIVAGDTPDSPADNTLPATVESTTFLGEIRQYLCRMADNSLWKVTQLAHCKPLQPQQTVGIRFPADAVAVVPVERTPANVT